VSFDAGHDILLTLVLDVDIDASEVVIDVNANPDANRRLLAASRMVFTVMQDGITVRWSNERIASATYQDRPAFRIPLPKSLRRIQRRSFFRIATPQANPVVCVVWGPRGPHCELPLVDISAEGIGVNLPTPPDPQIERGARLDDCRIELPDTGTIAVSLLVQNLWETELRNGRRVPRAGLSFLDPDPRTQALVQRYVTRLDRQRLATRPRV
jgi:c-di-GMP-binding flagellar brake protein YcgR